MQKEITRCLWMVMVIAAWSLSIILNLNGQVVSLTNVLFYLLPLTYCVLFTPDLQYLIKKKQQGGSPVNNYLQFLSNFYRYLFLFAFIAIALQVGSNLYFRESGWYRENVEACLEANGLEVQTRGILVIVDYTLTNGEIKKLSAVQSVLTGSQYRRIRTSFDDGRTKCEPDDK